MLSLKQMLSWYNYWWWLIVDVNRGTVTRQIHAAICWGQLECDRWCRNWSGVLTAAGIATSRQRWATDQWNKLVLRSSVLPSLCSASAPLQPLCRRSAWKSEHREILRTLNMSPWTASFFFFFFLKKHIVNKVEHLHLSVNKQQWMIIHNLTFHSFKLSSNEWTMQPFATEHLHSPYITQSGEFVPHEVK